MKIQVLNGEILALGTELLMGELTDTNSSYIASRLPHLGISVQRISLIKDNLEDLVSALNLALSRSDIIFTTGGLGPTHDDITREAIGSALNEDLKNMKLILKCHLLFAAGAFWANKFMKTHET